MGRERETDIDRERESEKKQHQYKIITGSKIGIVINLIYNFIITTYFK